MSDWKSKRQSIGREAAVRLAESGWWKDKTFRERAEFQFLTEELAMPFTVFHEAVEKALGRPVWTHEFGLNFEGLCSELFDGKAAPTMQEILDLIPEEKRILLVVK